MPGERKAESKLTLEKVNEFARGHESSLGPLKAMTNHGGESVFIYDMTKPRPVNKVVIVAGADGGASVPAGSDKVCEGEIFIAGQKKMAVAFRAKQKNP